MTIEISKEEKDELTRETLDRILYCPGYREKLIALNKKFNPHDETKHSYSAVSDISQFKFGLEKAIQ